MKYTSRFLAALVALVMLVGILPTIAVAEEAFSIVRQRHPKED